MTTHIRTPVMPDEAQLREGHALSFHITRPYSANAMWGRRMTAKGRRDLKPEYKAWRDAEGWRLRSELAGVPPIECRFDVRIELPPTRMDTDNAVKPILDLAQHIGLIVNDRQVHAVSIEPKDRIGCLVVFTPRPDLPARGGTKRTAKPATDSKARIRRGAAIYSGVVLGRR